MVLPAIRRLGFVVIGLLLCAVATGCLGPQPSDVRIFSKELQTSDLQMLSNDENESGVTVGSDLWAAARHPMRPGVISRLGEDSRRPPHEGFQIEILSPGDVGATVHFRW